MILILFMDLILLLASSLNFQAVTPSQEADCTKCHKVITAGATVHPVIEDACDNCHESTGEKHPDKGVKGFSLIEQSPQLCFFCHDEFPEMQYGHHPVREGKCLDCHNVHSSDQDYLLIKKYPELCLSCHSDIGKQLATGKSLHQPLSDGECNMCHLPHGSENSALLVEAFPEGEYAEATAESFAICFLCHDSQIIMEEKTEWGTNFRNGAQNLHFLHIKGKKGRSCKLCHNMHAGSEALLIDDNIAFGNWKMKLNFIPTENGGSCQPGCHGNAQYSRAGN